MSMNEQGLKEKSLGPIDSFTNSCLSIGREHLFGILITFMQNMDWKVE